MLCFMLPSLIPYWPSCVPMFHVGMGIVENFNANIKDFCQVETLRWMNEWIFAYNRAGVMSESVIVVRQTCLSTWCYLKKEK